MYMYTCLCIQCMHYALQAKLGTHCMLTACVCLWDFQESGSSTFIQVAILAISGMSASDSTFEVLGNTILLG